jgi:hypothetical protein
MPLRTSFEPLECESHGQHGGEVVVLVLVLVVLVELVRVLVVLVELVKVLVDEVVVVEVLVMVLVVVVVRVMVVEVPVSVVVVVVLMMQSPCIMGTPEAALHQADFEPCEMACNQVFGSGAFQSCCTSPSWTWCRACTAAAVAARTQAAPASKSVASTQGARRPHR